MAFDRIAVVGAGAWGCALANVIARAGRPVLLATRDRLDFNRATVGKTRHRSHHARQIVEVRQAVADEQHPQRSGWLWVRRHRCRNDERQEEQKE